MEKIIIVKAISTGVSVQVNIADYDPSASLGAVPAVHMYHLDCSPEDLRNAIYSSIGSLLKEEEV